MKEITKVIKVYSFDELSQESKQRACQQLGDRWTDKTCWCDEILELFVEELKNYGMTIAENDIKFSGFGSQGDGASFVCDCDNIDTRKLLHTLGIQVSDGLEEKVVNCIKVDIIRTSDRACHEHTVQVEVSIDEDALEESEEEEIRHIRDIADTLEFKLDELKDDLCQKLYYNLEREYDYLHSAECVDEVAYSNNMLFLANGLVYEE